MKNMSATTWLRQTNRYLFWPLFTLVLLSGLLSGGAVFFAYLSKAVIDAAEASAMERLVFFGVIAVAVMVLQVAFGALNKYLRGYYTAKADRKLKKHVFTSILKSEYPELQKHHSGAFMNHITSDVEKVSHGLVDIVPRFMFVVLRFLLALALLVYLDALFAMVMLAAGVTLFLGSIVIRGVVKKRHHDVQDTQSGLRAFMQESLGNIPIIKSFEAEAYMDRSAEEHQEAYFKASLRKTRLSVLSSSGLNAFFAFGFVFALLFGAYRITEGVITFGSLVAIMQLVNQIQTPFSSLSSLIPQYYATLASAERLRDVTSYRKEDSGDKSLQGAFESIVFEDVTFHYDSVPVLKAFSATIERGDIVHVKGRSGIGKTTLLKLLLGLHQPSEGSLRIQTDCEHAPVSPSTRAYFSYVPQDHLIFSGTIRENLVFNLENVTEAKLREACVSAGIATFIDALPRGFDSPIGERGQGLSEGQIQRLAIARGLLKDAPVLLLDEVTASLDEESEKNILDSIQKLTDKTCVIISHRELPDSLVTSRITL